MRTRLRILLLPLALALPTVWSITSAADLEQADARSRSNWPEKLDEIYSDETHCLVGSEIRAQKDNAISCYCRDAIMDARYVWETYLTPPASGPLRGKDENLFGVELTLEIHARQTCGEGYDVHKAVAANDWTWNGPEVVRTYPPDDVLRQIKPDSHGIVHYEYTVVLLQRDSRGNVVTTESFTAQDMVSIELLKHGAKPVPSKRRGPG